MQNLTLVVSLEEATGRPGKLVAIGAPGLSPNTGQIRPGNGWHYLFADLERSLFEWIVRSGGEIYAGPGIDLPNLDLTDIRDGLHIDSNQAVEIALRNGGQAFVDRYPAAVVIGNCRFQGRLVTWQLRFIESASTLCAPEFWINATDGRLMARDLSCIQ